MIVQLSHCMLGTIAFVSDRRFNPQVLAAHNLFTKCLFAAFLCQMLTKKTVLSDINLPWPYNITKFRFPWSCESDVGKQRNHQNKCWHHTFRPICRNFRFQFYILTMLCLISGYVQAQKPSPENHVLAQNTWFCWHKRRCKISRRHFKNIQFRRHKDGKQTQPAHRAFTPPPPVSSW